MAALELSVSVVGALVVTEISKAMKRKTIANPKVKYVMTFSEPRSFVFANTLRPPPVIAPEAPSDFPPWSSAKTMTIEDTMTKMMSYHVIKSYFLRG